jgi:hypothetical protein
MGEGSTGLVNDVWSPGGANYEATVDQMNAVRAAIPSAAFDGILFSQGEADSQVPVTEAAYGAAQEAMVAGFRADITGGSGMAFLHCGFVPGWLDDDAARQPVADAITDTPNRIANSAYVDTTGLTGNAGGEVHFDAASQRTLGSSFYTAYAGL